MTRAEAIAEIKDRIDLAKYVESSYADCLTIESLEMALEALEFSQNVPNDDLISRKAAIDAVSDACFELRGVFGDCEDALKALPSAQPERLTDDDFETIRIHLNAYKESLCNQRRWKEAEDYQRLINRFMSFASVQHERCIAEIKIDVDDLEKLVAEKVEEIKNMPIQSLITEPHWIPCSERLPEHDGELYLVTDYCEQINRKRIHMSCCYVNREGFWSDVPIGYKVIAWMPLPEPWKGEEE